MQNTTKSRELSVFFSLLKTNVQCTLYSVQFENHQNTRKYVQKKREELTMNTHLKFGTLLEPRVLGDKMCTVHFFGLSKKKQKIGDIRRKIGTLWDRLAKN